MIPKLKEKEKAIILRKEGLSYTEILAQVPVAKSSLALWLRSVGLSKSQKQRLTDKKLASARRGALQKKEYRILRTKIIKENAEKEVKKLTEREIWLIGTALYWAEGSKEKEFRPGSGIKFSNSDPKMIRFFINWLLNVCKINENMIGFEIYIHDNNRHRLDEVRDYWTLKTGFSKDNFQTIYFKKNKINTKRKNIGELYFGLLRVRVKSSSSWVRKVDGWIDGICKGSLN